MAFVDTPLPPRAQIEETWDIALAGEPRRLHGGEESAAYVLGDVVVRVSPGWRSLDELDWCYRVAAAAKVQVPEVVAPIVAADGGVVARIGGHPVSLWAFVDGEWADDEDDDQWEQAAALLGRLHRALADVDLGPRPPSGAPMATAPELDDPALDEWLDAFRASHPAQAQHGDYYRGNVLVRDGRIVAVIDWDEAILAPPEVGLANAVWEWCDGLWADDPSEDMAEFVELYVAAGGTAPGLSDEEMAQIIRARLRQEIRYSRANNPDPEYEARQLLVFERLRVPSGP